MKIKAGRLPRPYFVGKEQMPLKNIETKGTC